MPVEMAASFGLYIFFLRILLSLLLGPLSGVPIRMAADQFVFVQAFDNLLPSDAVCFVQFKVFVLFFFFEISECIFLLMNLVRLSELAIVDSSTREYENAAQQARQESAKEVEATAPNPERVGC
jgi:hypothetical protein